MPPIFAVFSLGCHKMPGAWRTSAPSGCDASGGFRAVEDDREDRRCWTPCLPDLLGRSRPGLNRFCCCDGINGISVFLFEAESQVWRLLQIPLNQTILTGKLGANDDIDSRSWLSRFDDLILWIGSVIFDADFYWFREWNFGLSLFQVASSIHKFSRRQMKDFRLRNSLSCYEKNKMQEKKAQKTRLPHSFFDGAIGFFFFLPKTIFFVGKAVAVAGEQRELLDCCACRGSVRFICRECLLLQWESQPEQALRFQEDSWEWNDV